MPPLILVEDVRVRHAGSLRAPPRAATERDSRGGTRRFPVISSGAQRGREISQAVSHHSLPPTHHSRPFPGCIQPDSLARHSRAGGNGVAAFLRLRVTRATYAVAPAPATLVRMTLCPAIPVDRACEHLSPVSAHPMTPAQLLKSLATLPPWSREAGHGLGNALNQGVQGGQIRLCVYSCSRDQGGQNSVRVGHLGPAPTFENLGTLASLMAGSRPWPCKHPWLRVPRMPDHRVASLVGSH